MKLKSDNASAVHFELRPKGHLLDPNFHGYKLSLESPPIYTAPLQGGVDHAVPTDEQYSLQHTKLSALSNHILSDPFSSVHVYTVDSNWALLKASINEETSRLQELSKVWVIPESPAKKPGRFNVTLSFPDEKHAVLADGCGSLFILETGDRHLDSAEWKIAFREEPFTSKKCLQFLILDSIFYREAESSLLDVLLLRIDERSEWKEFLEFHQDKYLSSSEHPFVSVLEWITFVQDKNDSWSIKSSRTLVGRSGVDYACIEPAGTALYLSSDDPYYFAYDSQNPIKFRESEEKPEAGQSCTEAEKKSDYVWAQTEADVTIWFRLPEDSKKSDFVVDVTCNDIHIEFKKQVMLDGKLFEAVKVDETVWTLESGKLELILQKAISGNTWPALVPGNDAGEQILDPELVDQIHTQLAHMCSDKWGADPHKSDVYDPQQLEECDAFPADTALLMRVDRKLQAITNQTSLGSHQWLFNVRSNPRHVSSICLRHDVDGVVWEPQLPQEKQITDEKGDRKVLDWNCEHIGTFSALGYVQASKESRKFTVSSPDLSYAAICDSVKHIHIYRQPTLIENELRNRKTGENVNHIAKQQVIAIDPPLEIMGAYAGNEFLYIITKNNIHVIRMNEPQHV